MRLEELRQAETKDAEVDLAPARKGPRVTIGIPVYNNELYLAQAIESVLLQTYEDFELIICDNASTDTTEQIGLWYAARDSRVYYTRNEVNMGAAYNYNRCFKLARGEYFKWLASDDVIETTYLERCVEALDANPEAVLAYTRGFGIDKDSRLLKEARHPVPLEAQADPIERFKAFRERSGFNAWPMLYVFGLMRTDVMRRTHLIAPYINSDNCLLYEMIFRGRWVEVPEVLSYYRIHAGSSTAYAHDKASRQKFFDPNPDRLTHLLGYRRLYLEYIVAIARSPLTWRQKLGIALYNLEWLVRRPPIDSAAEAESQLLPQT